MTTASSDEAARTAITDAVLLVSGVAFLRPALGELLRSATTARTGLPSGAVPRRTGGIKIINPGGERMTVEVHVVVLHGYRAVDVTRTIRQAVRTACPSTTHRIPVHVTVTGIL